MDSRKPGAPALRIGGGSQTDSGFVEIHTPRSRCAVSEFLLPFVQAEEDKLLVGLPGTRRAGRRIPEGKLHSRW